MLSKQRNKLDISPEWLDISWKGKIVEINGKGRIREKRKKAKAS